VGDVAASALSPIKYQVGIFLGKNFNYFDSEKHNFQIRTA
jgi:hypothetical protein